MPPSCRNQGCPGHYEEERVARAFQYPDNHIIVIEGIPAEICDFCGDTRFGPDAVKEIERIKTRPLAPSAYVPLFRYGAAAALAEGTASKEPAGVSGS